MAKTLVRNFIICGRISRLDFGIFKIRKSQKNPKIRNPPFPPWLFSCSRLKISLNARRCSEIKKFWNTWLFRIPWFLKQRQIMMVFVFDGYRWFPLLTMFFSYMKCTKRKSSQKWKTSVEQNEKIPSSVALLLRAPFENFSISGYLSHMLSWLFESSTYTF